MVLLKALQVLKKKKMNLDIKEITNKIIQSLLLGAVVWLFKLNNRINTLEVNQDNIKQSNKSNIQNLYNKQDKLKDRVSNLENNFFETKGYIRAKIK